MPKTSSVLYVCSIHQDQSCRLGDGVRNPHAVYNDESSVTQQQFKDECDINQILDRARRGMAITHLNVRVPQFGDVSAIPDFRTALDQVQRAQGLFMELDAQVRKRFDNDPAKFLDFVQNVDNRDEAASLGLLKPEVIEAIKSSKVAEKEREIQARIDKALSDAKVEKPEGGSK